MQINRAIKKHTKGGVTGRDKAQICSFLTGTKQYTPLKGSQNEY